MIHIKRISAILISVIIAAFSVLAGSAAVIYEQDGYKFTDLDANTVSLCGWDNRTPELILPNKIGDYYFAEILRKINIDYFTLQNICDNLKICLPV